MKHRIFIAINLLLFLAFLPVSILTSQDHLNCIDAIQISKGSTYEIDIDKLSIFYNQDNMKIESCGFPLEDYKKAGLWYLFEIEKEGLLEFDIIPVENVDLDFLVFKSFDGFCEHLLTLRCMFSGKTIGFPWAENKRCIGPMGLKEGEVDIVEGPGCELTSNNYLSPIPVVEGDFIYLLIYDNSYKNGNINYLVRPGGTAEY